MGSKYATYGVFRARERVWWLPMSFSPAEGANGAPPIALAAFDEPFETGKRGKGKEGNVRNGREKTGHITFTGRH